MRQTSDGFPKNLISRPLWKVLRITGLTGFVLSQTPVGSLARISFINRCLGRRALCEWLMPQRPSAAASSVVTSILGWPVYQFVTSDKDVVAAEDGKDPLAVVDTMKLAGTRKGERGHDFCLPDKGTRDNSWTFTRKRVRESYVLALSILCLHIIKML